jgi:hypothetical protein
MNNELSSIFFIGAQGLVPGLNFASALQRVREEDAQAGSHDLLTAFGGLAFAAYPQGSVQEIADMITSNTEQPLSPEEDQALMIGIASTQEVFGTISAGDTAS